MESIKFIRISNDSNFLCQQNASIRNAIAILNSSAENFIIVVNSSGVLVGTLTDGDLRRYVLSAKASLNDRVSFAMQSSPCVGFLSEDAKNIKLLWEVALPRPFLPILDSNRVPQGVLVGTRFEESIDTALILAGGRGKRLGDRTKNVPKPLLKIGGQTMLHRILNQLEASSFSNIYISVHHLADQFECFVNCRVHKSAVTLLPEKKPLGTAGSISLLPPGSGNHILVINGDVLTNVDLQLVKEMHLRNKNDATVVAAEHYTNLPFGVLRCDDSGTLQEIEEKPSYRHLVLAGIYCLSPVFRQLVPRGKNIDMPKLLNMGKSAGLKIGIFPLHEAWMDIGRPEDFD